MAEWTTDRENLQIYHIDGNLNLADLLTKKHELSLEDVSTDSPWQAGLDWMKLNTDDMPLMTYGQLTVQKPVQDLVKSECFEEGFL